MSTPLNQLKEIWGRLQPLQRVTVIGAAALTLAFGGSLIYFGTQPEYGVLFSDLKSEDAQGIVEKLKTANVPYRLSNGGSMISVPAEQITELRLQMAAPGTLSGGHVGFDIFDKSSFGTTDFAQRVNYQRALEGELARTLEGMHEVEMARVHITPARESIFTEKGESAKASVVMRIRQARELSSERTQAVVNLVASAVEDLDPKNISVMDTRGRVLTSAARDEAMNGAESFSSHLEMRQKLEADTAARIISLLEPITGLGRVRANVAATLDFSQVEQTEEKYDPKSSVIRSQKTKSEVRNNPQLQGGVAGARANDPAARSAPPTAPANGTPPPTAAVASPQADQRSESDTIYEIDKTVRRVVDGGGRLQRLSVSVVVDNQLIDGKPAPRSPEELKKMQELAAAAAGIDTKRGDQIVVESIPFDQPPTETGTRPVLERYGDLIQIGIKYGSLIIAAWILFFLVIRPAKRALREARLAPPLLLKASNVPAAEGTPSLMPRKAAEIGPEIGTEIGPQNGEDARAVLPLSDPRLDLKFPSVGQEADLPIGKTVAEYEAELKREMNATKPDVVRTIAIKNRLLEQGTSDPEVLAMTLRSWLEEKERR